MLNVGFTNWTSIDSAIAAGNDDGAHVSAWASFIDNVHAVFQALQADSFTSYWAGHTRVYGKKHGTFARLRVNGRWFGHVCLKCGAVIPNSRSHRCWTEVSDGSHH